MQFKKKVIYSGIASTIGLITAIFIPIVPCQTAPNVPNPIYKWQLCTINPDKISTLGSITKYFGYTTSLKDSYIILLLLIFAIVMIFFHYTTMRKKRN